MHQQMHRLLSEGTGNTTDQGLSQQRTTPLELCQKHSPQGLLTAARILFSSGELLEQFSKEE